MIFTVHDSLDGGLGTFNNRFAFYRHDFIRFKIDLSCVSKVELESMKIEDDIQSKNFI